jgi:hypothetical protein
MVVLLFDSFHIILGLSHVDFSPLFFLSASCHVSSNSYCVNMSRSHSLFLSVYPVLLPFFALNHKVLACGKWLSRFVDGLAPDSRLRGVVDTLQQVLVDTCATTCGTAFVTNPWQDGQVRVPWWFPSSAALEAQRAALDAAQRAAEEAALVEPPLKVCIFVPFFFPLPFNAFFFCA